jgi:hypothetical protein
MVLAARGRREVDDGGDVPVQDLRPTRALRRRALAIGLKATVGAALGLLALLYAGVVPGGGGRRLLVTLLAGLWSGRLALHLLKDRVIGKEEDGRYREMRRQWGARLRATAETA